MSITAVAIKVAIVKTARRTSLAAMALEANTTRIGGNCPQLRPVRPVRRDPARQLPPRMFLLHRRNRKPAMCRLQMTINLNSSNNNHNHNRIRTVGARVENTANQASRITITAIAIATATATVTDIPVTVPVARVVRCRLRVTTRAVPTI